MLAKRLPAACLIVCWCLQSIRQYQCQAVSCECKATFVQVSTDAVDYCDAGQRTAVNAFSALIGVVVAHFLKSVPARCNAAHMSRTILY